MRSYLFVLAVGATTGGGFFAGGASWAAQGLDGPGLTPTAVDVLPPRRPTFDQQDGVGDSRGGARTPRAAPSRTVHRGSVAHAPDEPPTPEIDDTHLDGGRVDRPGSFGNQPVRLPGPFLKKNTVAPHSKRPDLELSNDGRTSVGVFGSADTMDRADLRNGTSKSVRDLGAGLTLQYRFGQ